MKRGPRSSTPEHPFPGQVLDWLEGRLKGADRARLSRHMKTCAACRTEAREWTSLIDDFRLERADTPPQSLVTWAESLPRTVGKRSTRPSLLRLVADSWTGFLDSLQGASPLRPAAQLRSTDIPHRLGRRRLLFSAGGFDLDLEVDYVSHEDPRRLHGQILPAEGPRSMWADARVEFLAGRRVAAKARLDRRGEFRLTRLPAGRYRIRVTGPGDSASLAVEV